MQNTTDQNVVELNRIRAELKTLVPQQIKAKKELSGKSGQLSEDKSEIALRRNKIRKLHLQVAVLKLVLSQFPRGEKGLIIQAKELSDALCETKYTISTLAKEQLTLKRKISNDFVGLMDKTMKAQREKEINKVKIKMVQKRIDRLKTTLNEVNEKHYLEYQNVA